MVGMQIIQKLLNPIRRKVQLMIDRAVVTTVDNSLKRQNLQLTVLHDERVNNIERFIDYGLISYPPNGSEALVVCPGGNRSAMVATSVDDKSTRPTGGTQGDSGLYHLEGHSFLLTQDGTINLSGKRFNITLDTELVITVPSVRIVADETTIDGKLVVTDSIEAANISASDSLKVGDIDVGTHTHLDAENRPTKAPTP